MTPAVARDGAHQPGEHHPGEADAPDDHLRGAVHGPGVKAQLAQDHGGDGAPAHVHAADARGQGHRGDQPQAQDQAGDGKPARPQLMPAPGFRQVHGPVQVIGGQRTFFHVFSVLRLYMKITQWGGPPCSGGGRPRPPTDMAARDGRPTNTKKNP